MKRKLLATLTALIAVFCCGFGLTACGNTSTQPEEPTAFEKAYANYYKTQNMVVEVTDSRATKYGHNYTASVELDYAHKAAHAKHNGLEDYYEVTETNGNLGFTIYSASLTAENENTIWSKLNRDDLFDSRQELFDTPDDSAIHLLNNWVDGLLPTHSMSDTAYGATVDDDTNWVSLEFLSDRFTESNGVWTGDVCLRINDDGIYTPYPCTATIKIDEQNRFKSCELDFGANGKISAAFTYDTATVIIPDNVKNC